MVLDCLGWSSRVVHLHIANSKLRVRRRLELVSLCMHQTVRGDRLQLHDFEWLPAVALQYNVGQRQLADTHAILFLDTCGRPCLLQCHGLVAHTTLGLYRHNQPVDVLHDFRFWLCTHTEHAHGPAYGTSLTLDVRLQLAH